MKCRMFLVIQYLYQTGTVMFNDNLRLSYTRIFSIKQEILFDVKLDPRQCHVLQVVLRNHTSSDVCRSHVALTSIQFEVETTFSDSLPVQR